MRIDALDCETFNFGAGRKAPRLVSVAFGSPGRLYHREDWREGWLPELIDTLRNADEVVNHNLAYDLCVLLAELRRLHVAGKLSRLVFDELCRLVWSLYDDDRARCTFVVGLLIAIAKGEPAPEGGENGRRRKGLHGWNLDECCKAYTGLGVEGKHGPDIWRPRYHLYDNTPVSQWEPAADAYARNDPGHALRLYLAQRQYTGGERMKAELQTIRAAWCGQLAECWGIRTDPAIVDELQAYLDGVVREAHAKIRAVVGPYEAGGWLRGNGSKDEARFHARIEAVQRAAGLWDPTPGKGCVTKPTKKFPNGKTRADRKTLERCGEAGAEDLQALADAGQATTERNNFIKTLAAGVALPVNPQYFPCVESERISAKNPNVTNQPTRLIEFPSEVMSRINRRIPDTLYKLGIRNGYVPRPGWLYALCDYGTAELRAFAWVCYQWFGFSAMRDALMAQAAAEARGEPALDLHSKFAGRILGIDEAEALRRRLSGDKGFDEVRQLAKRINFGCLGMMGARTFLKTCEQAEVDLTLGGTLGNDPALVAETLLRIWHDTWPEVPMYFDRILGWLRRSGGHSIRVVSLSGGLLRGGCDGPAAANHFFQNLVAQWTKRSWYRLAREGYLDKSSPFYGCRPVIVVHDEIISEVPAHRAHAAAVRQSVVMKEEAQLVCPGMVIEAEPALAERWHKGAEPRYSEQGLLLPWQTKPPKKKAA